MQGSRTSASGQAAGTLAERVERALQDDFLRRAVQFTTQRLRHNKQQAAAALGQWEAWRERGRQIRAHTVAHLDRYLQQFVENVRRHGGHVHFAADAAEAVHLVVQLACDRGVRLAVKSKSMVSEEVHLNDGLTAAGVRVVETDLGEYIIQLAGEPPSHLIAPAIHKNREQIRDLFCAAGGRGLTTDTPSLAGFARQQLRQLFLTADLGISGCNFAIAETGTVVLFTNEGNGRMVTSLPRTHIVMLGMERLLPTLADLEVMANLLPRSATGQKLTAYMTLLTGPRREGEGDGPEELHVVVLDNGRSNLLGDPAFQDVLHCIRCGACLNVCPVYRQVGGHAYGSVYPGPIGAVLTPLLQPGPETADLPYASSLCGACFEACPVKIPLHDLLVRLRQRNVERGWVKPGERLAWYAFQRTFARPGRYRRVMRLARWAQAGRVQAGELAQAPGPLRGWTASRQAPALAARSFQERWSALAAELRERPAAKEDANDA
ncbi:MAG: iron-sulfur cluster-binding protein [Alicyclobacillus sp.]|nr:iron-sulfur cluster-binding protein [Alicyclobacillus sp.]